MGSSESREQRMEAKKFVALARSHPGSSWLSRFNVYWSPGGNHYCGGESCGCGPYGPSEHSYSSPGWGLSNFVQVREPMSAKTTDSEWKQFQKCLSSVPTVASKPSLDGSTNAKWQTTDKFICQRGAVQWMLDKQKENLLSNDLFK